MADGKVGAPTGNTNSSKDNRLWRNTILRAIAQGDPERLRLIAESLLNKAAEGDVSALRELGDRIDGKPTQAVEMSGPGGAPLEVTDPARPKLTKEEWLVAHGVGTAARPAK